MEDFSIYSLNSSNIKIMSSESIKTKYINVFNNTLMIMGYVDYTKVLNLKYGSQEKYTLNIKSVIKLFFELLKDENVGVYCLEEEKLKELHDSFNFINNNKSLLEQTNDLLCNMLINWYFANNTNFEYPISGLDYIDKNSEDLSYIISSSYSVTN